MRATTAFHTPGRTFLVACLLAFLGVVTAACGPSDPPTPPDPNVERAAILDAMHQGRQIPDQIFVVHDLKVQDGWAWVTAAPQSNDGSQRYESESWLLRKSGDTWKVAAQPCAEEGCEPKAEIAKIRGRFPEAPDEIFPIY